MLILSYENKFNLHVNENSFSYERTWFENEAKGNSEMAYFHISFFLSKDKRLIKNSYAENAL